ncbi:MAG TPA: hypothetical protein VF221_22495 [Chloroflexota bacterium]
MPRSLFPAICTLFVCVLPACPPAIAAGRPAHPAANRAPVVVSTYVAVQLQNGTTRSRAMAVASEIDDLHARIGHDLGDNPPRLQVQLYASHAAFTQALWAAQHARPQSSTDDTSSIMRGTLLLGPLPDAYLRHNLAHVYTEWILDRLTGNHSDTLPATTWLYDGLAEYEAYRYAPAGMECDVRSPPPIDITIVRTAMQWMSIRAGPLGSLEYCLAYTKTRDLISRVGWAGVVRTLHARLSWAAAARHLLAMEQLSRSLSSPHAQNHARLIVAARPSTLAGTSAPTPRIRVRKHTAAGARPYRDAHTPHWKPAVILPQHLPAADALHFAGVWLRDGDPPRAHRSPGR